MSRTITHTDGFFARIEEENEVFLGIRFSESAKSYTLAQSGTKKDGTCFFVKDGRVSPWTMERSFVHEGQVWGIGPFIDGRPLSTIIDSNPEEPERLVESLASAFSVLKTSTVSRIMTSAVLVSEESMLFLPDEFTGRIEKTAGEQIRINSFSGFNHPGLSGEENLSFFLGALSYRLFAGRLPFSGTSEEEVRQAVREKRVQRLLYLAPEIQPEVSAFIMSALRAEGEAPPSLSDWVKTAALWRSEGVRRSLTEAERSEILLEGERINAYAEKRHKTREFFRKHWKALAVTAAALAVAASIAGSILKNVMAPPVTLGLSAEEVVRLFYMSQNSLDHEAIEDCVAEDAGKPEIEEAMNLFVISRVRTAYEHTAGYVDADQWTQEGRPELEDGQLPYGVAHLDLKETGEGKFRAAYEKWVPVSGSDSEDGESAAVAKPFKRVDELYLREEPVRGGKKRWAIYRIDRKTDSLIE